MLLNSTFCLLGLRLAFRLALRPAKRQKLLQVAYFFTWPVLGTGVILAVKPELPNENIVRVRYLKLCIQPDDVKAAVNAVGARPARGCTYAHTPMQEVKMHTEMIPKWKALLPGTECHTAHGQHACNANAAHGCMLAMQVHTRVQSTRRCMPHSAASQRCRACVRANMHLGVIKPPTRST